MLSRRLKTIVNFVDKSDRLVDVGCDHALLAIHLVKNRLASKVIATDINQNALDNAIKNIEKEHLSKEIATVLSDGLENIEVIHNKINTVVISGMGATTILKILENAKFDHISKIIIQSNNDHQLLRKNIKNFYLKDEKITYDNKKYYLTMLFTKEKPSVKYDRYFGIIKKENLDYYNFTLAKYYQILIKIPNKKIVSKLRMKQLINKLNKIINKLS